MKILKQGRETISLGFSGDRGKLKKYKKIKSPDDYESFFELKRSDGTPLNSEMKSICTFFADYKYITELIDSIADGRDIVRVETENKDRIMRSYLYKNHRIFQTTFCKRGREMSIGNVHVDAMALMFKDTAINKIVDEVINLNYRYLSRIDFYRDFNGSHKEFMEKSTIRRFKKTDMVGGDLQKDGTMFYNESSTIYRGKNGETENERIIARLYNKWVDSIKRKKLKYYDYICEDTRRFEVGVYVNEITSWKKTIEINKKGYKIKDFFEFLYKNVILKERVDANGAKLKKFDVPFIKDPIFEIQYKKIKYAVKNQESEKIKRFVGYARNMCENLGEENFMKYIEIAKKDAIGL